jgi:amino-acid N-acetyltransferase
MLRKAKVSDIDAILAVIKPFVEKDIILARTHEDVEQRIRDYVLFEEDNTVLGCAALNPGWDNLGEIRTTAVDAGAQGKGIGRMIVKACLDEARELGLKRVFALTYQPDFFKRLGFADIEKSELPQKIWGDCVKCVKFPDCDEFALAIELK